jgi:hypothetical protein
MRSRLFGLLDRDHAGAAARIVLTEHGSGGPRMSVEFVLPGHKAAVDLGSLSSPSPPQPQHDQHHVQQPKRPVRIEPRVDDVVLERTLPSAFEKPLGSYGWLK